MRDFVVHVVVSALLLAIFNLVATSLLHPRKTG
jgi:hypothetical protein